MNVHSGNSSSCLLIPRKAGCYSRGHAMCPRTSQSGFSSNQKYAVGFPGGAVVKNPPASAGDMGSSPGPGRSHMPRNN